MIIKTIYKNVFRDKLQILSDNLGKSGVYRFTNLSNGKSYIGSSVNLGRRFRNYFNSKHLKANKMIIYKAFLKHGHSNFNLEILEYCPIEKCLEREQHYLDLFQPDYNILKIAGSLRGYKHTQETKVKMSATALGRKHSEETIAKLRNLTMEKKAKRLEQLKGINSNPEHQAKRLEHLKRLNQNPDLKAKRLEQLNRINDAKRKQHQEKRLERLKRLHTKRLEYQAKRLERLKRLHQNPEYQAKRLEGLKRLHQNPEYQAKRLEGLERLNSSPEQKEHLKRLHSDQSQRVSVLDSKTNETTVYSSISEAARAISTNQSSISSAFKRKGDGSKTVCIKTRYVITKLSN